MRISYSIPSIQIQLPIPDGTAVTVGTSGAVLPNKNLRPMRIKEVEAGLEVRLFKSRVNLDIAVYKRSVQSIRLFLSRYQMDLRFYEYTYQ